MGGPVLRQPIDDERVYERRWAILGVLCLSLFLVVVGNTILNVALPTLVRELDASSSQLQWIVDSYGLVFAGLLLTVGALGDRFGRKGALSIGLGIFAGARSWPRSPAPPASSSPPGRPWASAPRW